MKTKHLSVQMTKLPLLRASLLGAVLLGASRLSLLAQQYPSGQVVLSANSSQGSDEYLGYNNSMDGSYTSAQASQSFTGLDRNNNIRTMTYTGFASTSATYGQLHVNASATVSNTYYNASNVPLSYTTNPATGPVFSGSPDGFTSYASSTFGDTLNYQGSSLQAGDSVQYTFHVDGSLSGYGVQEDLFFDPQSGGSDVAFTNTSVGNVDADYTADVTLDSSLSQTIFLTLDGYFDLSTEDVPDGSTESGEANFSDTATLSAIEVVDANGNPVPGVTVSSDSGTTYPVNAAPEPSTLALATVAALPLLAGYWRLRRRSSLPAAA